MDNEVSTEVHAIHPSGLPLACGSRLEREPLGFPPSFGPRRYQRRPSGWGQALEYWPRTTLSTSVDPPVLEFTRSVRPHVARVVPLAVEGVPGQVLGFQISHFAVGDLDAFWVDGVVQFGSDGQAGAGSESGDEVDDDFVAGQQLATPVH